MRQLLAVVVCIAIPLSAFSRRSCIRTVSEAIMRRLLKASALLLCLSYAGAIYGQSLIVTAVFHSTREHAYTTSTPQQSNTTCTTSDTSINCNTTTYGGTSQQHRVQIYASGHCQSERTSHSIQFVSNSPVGVEFDGLANGWRLFPRRNQGGAHVHNVSKGRQSR
jgi:hypothetical protein